MTMNCTWSSVSQTDCHQHRHSSPQRDCKEGVETIEGTTQDLGPTARSTAPHCHDVAYEHQPKRAVCCTSTNLTAIHLVPK